MSFASTRKATLFGFNWFAILVVSAALLSTSARAADPKAAPAATETKAKEALAKEAIKDVPEPSLDFPKKGDVCILSASMNRIGDNVPSELVELSCDGGAPRVQARDGKNQDVNQTLSRELASAKKAGWKIGQCSYVNAFNPERGPYSYFDFKKMICILNR